MIHENESYFQQLRARTVNTNIKSLFVTYGGLLEAIGFVSQDFKEAIVIEPMDLDGFVKVKIVEAMHGNATPNN